MPSGEPTRYDTHHLIVSLVVLVGGGYLAARYPEMRGELGTLLGGLCGFWFGTRAGNGNGQSNGMGSAR
jgi:hypothetical protein